MTARHKIAQRSWYKTHGLEYYRRWRKKNRLKLRAYWQLYRKQPKQLLYQARWKQSAKGRAIQQAYNKSPKGRATKLARTHARRAKILGNGGAWTRAEFIELCRRYHNRCACCGKKTALEPDHIRPVSKGGANVVGNLQPLCRRCNISKNAKTGAYTCVCGRQHNKAVRRIRVKEQK